jgi:hypothetical protein
VWSRHAGDYARTADDVQAAVAEAEIAQPVACRTLQRIKLFLKAFLMVGLTWKIVTRLPQNTISHYIISRESFVRFTTP